MLPAVSFFERLRNMLSGPAHVDDGGEPEAAADLQEELGTPDAGEADLERMENLPGRLVGGIAGSEAAEAAEAELESEAAPPDPDA